MVWDGKERRNAHEECLHEEWRKNVEIHVKKGDDAMLVVHNHEQRITSLERSDNANREDARRLLYSLAGSTLVIVITLLGTWGKSQEMQGRLFEKVDRIEKQHDMEYARDLKSVGEHEKEIVR
jgi:hypothetical protein